MDLSEIVVHNAFWVYTERIEVVGNCLDEHRRSAEIVLAILWSLVVLQVCIADTVYCKSFVILHALSIGNRVLAVEREVEVEVRIFLLQFPEVLKEEGLAFIP